MPLSIWTRDQVPELALRGMEALGQGAAGAGAAIGSGIEKRLDESKRLNTAGKAAKTFLDALIDASDDDDTNKSMRKEANKGLSSTDAIAAMTGKLQAQGYATAQAHFKEVMLRLTGQKAQNENLAKAPAFYQEAAGYGTAPGDVPFDATPAEFERRTAPLDVRALMAAAGKTGYNPGNQVDDLLRALKTAQAESGPPIIDQVDLPYGRKGAVLRGSKDLKTFEDPKALTQAEEMVDTEGNVIGHRVPIGNGRFTFRPLKAGPDSEAHPLLHPGTGQPIPGWVVINGKPVDVRTIMEKAGLQPPGAPAAGAPAKPAQFKKGDKVKQNGVTYEFDGKDWTAVK
jgi:hypothetical protein